VAAVGEGPAEAPVPFRAKPRAARRRLRVGVFADSPSQPRWIHDALASIGASDFAEIALLAVNEPRGVAFEGSSLLQAYAHVDHWLFGTGEDPCSPVRLETLVPPSERLPLRPGDCDWRARVSDLRLDVCFVVGSLDDASLEGLARHGVWRYCFGEALRPELAAMREVLDEVPVVASGIRITRAGAERYASRSWSRTFPFSLARSRQRLFGRAVDGLARSLRRLHEHGDGWLEGEGEPAPPRAADRQPNVAESVRGITRLGARIARRGIETCFTVGQWSLAYRFAGEEPWDGKLDGFHRLVPPADRFWADPFPISVGGRHYIFFEELPFASSKGHICVLEVDREGRASTPVRIIERDYHLSYPFLLEHDGALFMIPESAYGNQVQIFRCEEFPHRWRPEKVLLDGVFAADATLHRQGDRWWMFANLGTEASGVDDELHLFSADDLFGEWKPHGRNPVKCDVRSSRPAGKLFERDGVLYRPGQICAPIYGSGIVLHRVTRLDDEGYAEEEDRRITGVAPILGMHTINRAGDLSVTDVFARRMRF
jgi:hypothetical protein